MRTEVRTVVSGWGTNREQESTDLGIRIDQKGGRELALSHALLLSTWVSGYLEKSWLWWLVFCEEEEEKSQMGMDWESGE